MYIVQCTYTGHILCNQRLTYIQQFARNFRGKNEYNSPHSREPDYTSDHYETRSVRVAPSPRNQPHPINRPHQDAYEDRLKLLEATSSYLLTLNLHGVLNKHNSLLRNVR